MRNKEIDKFILEQREKGLSDSNISEILIKNGWNAKDVDNLLKPSENQGVPVPPPQHFGMWVGFLYIIFFISLYVVATTLGGMMHFAVDENISDKLDNVNYSRYLGQYLVQGYLAGLVVSFPIFAALSIILKRQIIKNPGVKGLKIRKFLIYFTLVATFLIMLGHIIGTVYGFFGGEITTRAIAHLGVTLLVAGLIFVYYLLDVRGDRKQ